jgi:hypothetical protein
MWPGDGGIPVRHKFPLAGSMPSGLHSEFLIRQEKGLAHCCQIDMPRNQRTHRPFRPKGAAHTSPEQGSGYRTKNMNAF